MKKILALIMIAALTIGTMAGCSQTTLNYSKELSNMAKWEKTTTNIEGKVNVDLQGIKEEITFTGTGFKDKDITYVDMKFNSASGKFKIPEIREYLYANTVYINKSYFEGIYTMTGQVVPEGLANIKEEYIAIDSSATGMDLNKIKELTTKPDSIIEMGKLMFGDKKDLDIPFTQSGREYTINLDADKAVDLSAKAIKALGNNIEKYNTTFLGSKLTTQNIAQIKTVVNDEKFDAGLPQIKELLAGSTITSKEAFTDNRYTSDFNVNLQLKDMGKVSIKMKSTSWKSERNSITLPTNEVKLTTEEYMKLAIPTNKTVATTSNIVTK